jgi:hypothetical protein
MRVAPVRFSPSSSGRNSAKGSGRRIQRQGELDGRG